MPQGCKHGFVHPLRQGGVPEYDERDVLGAGTEFHRDDDLLDQISRARPDDVATENAVGLFVAEDLDQARQDSAFGL